MKKKILGILLSASIAVCAFAACTPAKETDESAEESVQDEFAYPYTFTDVYGNEVTIESEPEKVVSVSPALTEIVYDLGSDASSKLVGRSDYDDYPAEVFDVQAVGPIDMPDIELIASLEPDVVIASSIFSEEAYNALTDLGIPVVIIIDEDTIDGVISNVTTVADVIGAHEAGVELAQELTDELQTIRDNAVETDATVYYCMGFGEYGEYTAGNDTFIHQIITTAGAQNAAADVEGWSYSVEQLLENDPDYILVPEWGYDLFISSEPYNQLTAVQEGRVIAVDNNIFERQTPRNLEAVELIEEAISADASAQDAAA